MEKVEEEIAKVQTDIEAVAPRIVETEDRIRTVEEKLEQAKAQYLGAQTDDEKWFWSQELNSLRDEKKALLDEKLMMLRRQVIPLQLPLPESWIRFCGALPVALRTPMDEYGRCVIALPSGISWAEKRCLEDAWLCDRAFIACWIGCAVSGD